MRIIEPYQLYGQRARRERKGRLKALLSTVLVLAFVCAGYSAYALLRSQPVVYPSYLLEAEAGQPPANLPWPVYGQSAIGALGYEALASSGNNPAVPTASIAKVMTALAVLKKHPLALNQPGPLITLSEKDVQLYRDYLAKDGSVVPVAAGEQISLYQALQAVLLPSGNNMADSLAIWGFGSVAEYLKYANNLAGEIGMSQSRFADDASGLSPNSVSTANDLVKLGLAALKEPVLAQIVGQASAVIPVAGNIKNINTMLGKNDILGIKTGNTDQAGSCYLFAATHALTGGTKVTIVGAIMGAQNLPIAFRDASNLLQASYSNFVEETVVRANEIVAEYRLPWGTPVTVYAQSDIKRLAWRGRSSPPKIILDPLKAGSGTSQQVGSISANNGPQQVSSPLIIKDRLLRPSAWWRLAHPF